MSSVQESENLKAVKRKGTYRILCLGESTTYRQYPEPLERILNERNTGVRFSVIDKGRPATTSTAILGEVEAYLDEYRPDMVITMMGINDHSIRYYQDIPESRSWFFEHCRVYRFCRILLMNFLKKMQPHGMDSIQPAIERSPAAGSLSHVEGRGADPRTLFRSEQDISARISQEARQDDRVYVERGWALYSNRQFAQAGRYFQKALELNPENDLAYTGLGTVYHRQYQLVLAESSLEKALGINPKDGRTYHELGEVYRDEGQFDKAEICFKKAISVDPVLVRSYIGLGVLYQLRDQFSQSEAMLKKAIALHPQATDLYNAYFQLGKVYYLQARFAEADEAYRQAVAFDPGNPEAYFELGATYRDQHNFQESEKFFRKATEIDPRHYRAYFRLGALNREQGRLPEAESLFKRSLEINPRYERAAGALASLYQELKKAELAGAYKEKARLLREEAGDASTVSNHNYRELKRMLDQRGILLVCVQYPMRSIAPLKRIFQNDPGAIFVDNESLFKNAIKNEGYQTYFKDMFGGDFGHCTLKGNELVAKNIASVILKAVFKK